MRTIDGQDCLNLMDSKLGVNSTSFRRRIVGRIVLYGFLLLLMMAMLLIAIPPSRRGGAGYHRVKCMANLKMIEAGKQFWAIERSATNGTVINLNDLIGGGKYLPQVPKCPAGGSYSVGAVGQEPTCSLAGKGHSLDGK